MRRRAVSDSRLSGADGGISSASVRPPTKSAHSSHFTGESPVTRNGEGQNENGDQRAAKSPSEAPPAFRRTRASSLQAREGNAFSCSSSQSRTSARASPLRSSSGPPTGTSDCPGRGRYEKTAMTRSVVAQVAHPTRRWSDSRYDGSRRSRRKISSVRSSSGLPQVGQGGTKNDRDGLS